MQPTSTEVLQNIEALQTELTEVERERLIVAVNTILWWTEAHQQDTPYHRQFRGYCLRCTLP
jgi:hypothetical protein